MNARLRVPMVGALLCLAATAHADLMLTPTAKIDVLWGRLRVRTLSLASPPLLLPANVVVTLNGRKIAAELTVAQDHASIRLAADAMVETGGRLGVKLS